MFNGLNSIYTECNQTKRATLDNGTRRRWRVLVAETAFACIILSIAVYVAMPVFLKPLKTEPEAPLTTKDLLATLNKNSILGYAPNKSPFVAIMARAKELLNISEIMEDATEFDLNNNLYKSKAITSSSRNKSVIWIIWKPEEGGLYQFSIRSTERALYATSTDFKAYPNPHLRAGFLAVQMAISQAIIETATGTIAQYEVNLVSMPVSPLMHQDQVKKVLSTILLCFTLAFIPPVLETQALVVQETKNHFKRGLRMYGVGYSSMYLGWLLFTFLTAMPICFVAAITLLLIFRWIHLVFALVLLMAYTIAMVLTGLIMSMFHSKTWVTCLWSSLFTFLQTYLADLLVHHEYDMIHGALTFAMHIVLPPLGLVNAMNEFALLQTGHSTETKSLLHSFMSWSALILFYFSLLMFLQSTIGRERAIGGQVSWKSIIFKKVEDVNELHEIETPTGRERDKLQKVDELVAKAVSFKNVSKSIMGVKVLDKITLDIYRGEFTIVFAERLQEKMIITIEDLLTGLSFADHGTINVLGHVMRPNKNYMNRCYMMGYCNLSSFLVKDLTVTEHIDLFTEICLWSETREYTKQYSNIRAASLISEGDLENVRNQQVRHLDVYYHAQLCWALAMLLQPRVVILPTVLDQHPRYIMVIRDKIMQYKKHITLIEMCFSSLQLEYSDRVFIFDSKILCFGGTPAYMFFKYGREYRVRMTIRNTGFDEQSINELLNRAAQAGATVRAHLGSLLILRLPASPTDVVAELVKDLTANSTHYGMLSLHISVPDSEEVYKRAMTESRTTIYKTNLSYDIAKNALERMSEPPKWERKMTVFSNKIHIANIFWKYFAFHIHHRPFILVAFLAALLAGIGIGLSLSNLLQQSKRDSATNKLLRGDILTMESTHQKTTLVMHVDKKANSISLAHSYIFSEPKAKNKDVKFITYTALASSESLTEYLVTRAIDSPQLYLHNFAYGMDVTSDKRGILKVNALYSPLHSDYGSAARSLAKVNTALLRHFTGKLNASIQVTDNPLALDLTPWMRYATKPPLFVGFLLIVAMSHVTLIPSIENGLIRHTQSHAMNFSPAQYWFTLYICDIILYWIQVCVITGVMMLIMYFVAPSAHFDYLDLLVVPFLLILYGFACVPQAYLFSLGPQVGLNTTMFIILNIVLGETTVIAKLFYGDVLTLALLLMSLSPQFNMAYAFIKIKQIFLYNSECIIFKSQGLCSSKILHKCCQKCGVLQDCFSKRNYLSIKPGILVECLALITVGVLCLTILLILEYRIIQRIWRLLKRRKTVERQKTIQPGALKEKEEVLEKWKQIKQKRFDRFDTFGEYLLAHNLSQKKRGVYTTNSIYLGLGKGETLALSGLKRHGRLKLLKLLAGYSFPDEGHAYCMSKWNLAKDPHQYARAISMSCDRDLLPPWMTVYDALELIAVLRGVPRKHVREELTNILDALEIKDQAELLVCQIQQKANRARVHFATAIVGAPPVIILDECTAHQKFSVRRSMYSILYFMKKRGHAILNSSSSVEAHMPLTNRLAIMVDGAIFDIDNINNLIERYSNKGYTVVVHLKDEVNVRDMFARHFQDFIINDSIEVLVNVQILDEYLTWATLFTKMEILKKKNEQVYSYIVTAIPIDYIYNSIIYNEKGFTVTSDLIKNRFKRKSTKIKPSKEQLDALIPFEQKYDIMTLKTLPWSVIFHT